MKTSKQKLFDGTIIYFIGNTATTFLQFLLLPIITNILDPDDYGYFDLVVTTAILLTPIVTLQVTDAVFRFFFDSDEREKATYFTNGVSVIGTGIIVAVVGTVLFDFFFNDVILLPLVIGYFVSSVVFILYQKVIRSLGHNLVFVKSNFIRAFSYIIFQIILLVGFGLGLESLFISAIASTVLGMLFAEYKVRLRNYFNFRLLNKKVAKEMITFSAPLIPNSLLWWTVSSLNTYIISFVIGINANGIYAVANKFAGIIAMVSSVFLTAWQESVIMENESKDKTQFYSEITNLFIKVLFSAAIVLIPVIKFLMPEMIDPKYYESLEYAPVLMLSAAFGAMTGFYGAGYLASKKTIQSMWTTIYGVIVNVVITLIGIHYIGLYAPVLGMTLANLAIWIVRHKTLKKEMGVVLNIQNIIFLAFLVMVALTIYYLGNSLVNIISAAVFTLIALYMNYKFIKKMFDYANSTVFAKIRNRGKE